MKNIVMASYQINTENDIEADLIVNTEACSFVELIAIEDGIQSINDGMNKLYKNPEAKDILVLHGESLHRLINVIVGD
ncbi:hypothetical protein RFI36_02995 [Acinetobacter gerneri]|uniref:Uncharacterized protein n=1 Tax=Acinetobacter gerneri TaxID=202952 RepID=A0AAW8JKL0_9GAMM|nr:hypothetical protein [Acinetobacter gerneri]MDQ9008638.1 hypothetical protein [Acinetobacter gerneri]MDQ9012814.1 hypothetical protein [Acinetobacter gerneri]MDQ9024177.1 hypothetical protein [Acinetobacter gerneri]MDQ9051414.1 hypothetical protein [Acinetobacter gerneri]MDQ9058637.1 hypothetical protein [Acinetobacter gerneri]